MRHRRRCQGPAKPQNRRKACDACVAAKTRCSYEQPTCARCAKRATPCIYAARPDTSSGTTPTSTEIIQDSDMDTSDSSDTSGSPQSPITTTLDPRNSFSLTTTAETMDPALWDTTVQSSWPINPFGFPHDSTMEDPTSVLTFETNASAATITSQLSMSTDYCFLQSDGLDAVQSPLSTVNLPFSSLSWSLPPSTHTAPLPALDKSTLPPISSTGIARLLGDYPSKLLCEQSVSPLLHHSLFSDNVADVTTLPSTSMAICCAVGLEARHSRRFVKRAIHAERQRLIEAFVSPVNYPSFSLSLTVI